MEDDRHLTKDYLFLAKVFRRPCSQINMQIIFQVRDGYHGHGEGSRGRDAKCKVEGNIDRAIGVVLFSNNSFLVDIFIIHGTLLLLFSSQSWAWQHSNSKW